MPSRWARLQALLLLSMGAVVAGCSYFADTFAQPVGPERAASSVVVSVEGPSCAKPIKGADIEAGYPWITCSQSGSIERIREEAGKLGYTGIMNAHCLSSGIVAKGNCDCTATPYYCG